MQDSIIQFFIEPEKLDKFDLSQLSVLLVSISYIIDEADPRYANFIGQIAVPYLHQRIIKEAKETASSHTLQQLTKCLNRCMLCPNVDEKLSGEISQIKQELDQVATELFSSEEIDMQALANDLINTAKIKKEKVFNTLIRSRLPFLQAGIEKATLQDFVLILSSFGIRISLQMTGVTDLLRSEPTRNLLANIAKRICEADMIHSGAKITQIASLIWAISIMP